MRKAEIICEYQDYIDQAPVAPRALYEKAAGNDQQTVEMWRDVWISQTKANHAKLGPFKNRSLGKLHGRFRNLPALVLGSGPSLKKNAELLKGGAGGIPIISCLHNFHFLEDLGVPVDYYVTLDAGPVTVEEVSEGGGKKADDYWAMSKGKTLLAFVGSHPDLLAKWQGEILFYNCPIPDPQVRDEMLAVEPFHLFVGTGGNVLGAAVYIAKAIFGCPTIALLGADFSFGYDCKFHGWDSKYDKKMGHTLRATDVFGNSVRTWPSYHNFKSWFDWLAQSVPGNWINCTEGGTWGAYAGGNLRAVRQMDLKDFLYMHSLIEHTRASCERPDEKNLHVLF